MGVDHLRFSTQPLYRCLATLLYVMFLFLRRSKENGKEFLTFFCPLGRQEVTMRMIFVSSAQDLIRSFCSKQSGNG